MRVGAPFVLGSVCLVVADWTGPVLTWVLLIAAFGLILDGATLLFSRGGGLRDHRQ
ncbi:MAG TPA: hypothetical protein VLB47_02430 [Solirubrobacteraceae bacterium]|nr:hypothetical protein [Solirubrobacteraceae bacterium]